MNFLKMALNSFFHWILWIEFKFFGNRSIALTFTHNCADKLNQFVHLDLHT